MVKVSFDVKKRYFLIVLVVLATGFVISQYNDPSVFGHHVDDIEGLSGGGSGSVEDGQEFFIGSMDSNGVQSTNLGHHGWKMGNIDFKTMNGIKEVRIVVTGTGGLLNIPSSCDELVLDALNGFQATCGTNGPESFKWDRNDCDTPANIDWFSFDVYGLDPANHKDRIEEDGIEKIIGVVCDDSSGNGEVDFQIYATPYASRIDDKRMQAYMPSQDLTFSLISQS